MCIKNLLFALIFYLSAGFVSNANLLEVKIWTDKLEYLVREPIIVNYRIKNVSNSIIRMTFLDLPFHFKIEDQNGVSYTSRFSIQVGIANNDSLRPGEEYKNGANITDIYGVISAGEYTCYFENRQGSRDYISPIGKSNVIKITVKEPEGEEKKALNMFLEAEKLKYSRDEQHGGRDLKKAELGFLKYQELVDKYPNSIYAPLALDGAVGVYQYSPDFQSMKKVIPVCKRLIENYPNSIYFLSTFTSLTGVYEVLKDKAGAINEMNELIQKHPNSKISEEAERRLQHIEEWKF